MSHPAVPFPALLWPVQWALPAGVQAICTTRLGGVSHAPFDGLNLGDHVQDDPAAVTANRALLHEWMAGARPVFLKQVHGVDVVRIDATTPDGTVADACVAVDKGVVCTIMVADCLPLLFTDDAGRVVAAAHAGWRGLAGGVVEQTVASICTLAQVPPAQIRVWLGPCIGAQAFEVGHDVRDAFRTIGEAVDLERYFKAHPHDDSKWLADLAGLARHRLATLGVLAVSGNDSTPAWCTVSQPSRLFSYRRDGVTGRFAACIWRT